MINAFKNSLAVFLKNPFVLLPGIAVAIIAVFLSDMTVVPMLAAVYDFAIPQGGMQLGFFEAVSLFSKAYAGLLLLVLAIFLLSAVLSAMLMFFCSKYAMRFREKSAFSDSLKFMFSMLPQAISLVLAGMVFAFLAFILLSLMVLFFPPHIISGAVICLALLIFAFSFLKLFLFAAPAIAVDGLSAREGLAASWRFTSKKFLESLLALAVVIFSVAIITNIGLLVLEPLAEGILSFAVSAIFDSLVFSFASLFFAFYYLDNRGEAGQNEAKRHEPWKKREKK
ncbi:MAG: hypothetical protein NT067_02245 [Candidatus Diapherotrites archaeon]|nr:hypothetical protein [Candidatus Diapherotrites archaeon]